MKYAALSASGAMRAYECPGSYALPFDESEPGFPAVRGTFIHKYLEMFWENPNEAELWVIRNDSEYFRKLAFSIDAEAIVADVKATAHGEVTAELLEQPFAFDGGARLLDKGKHGDRKYPEGAFGGTADVVLVTNEMVSITDYKTGSKIVESDDPQMRVLAAFAYMVWQRPVSTTILTIHSSGFSRKNPKPVRHDSGSPKMWTTSELEGCVDFMRDIYSRVQVARDDRGKGLPVFTSRNDDAQCRYCDCKPYCPEWATSEAAE